MKLLALVQTLLVLLALAYSNTTIDVTHEPSGQDYWSDVLLTGDDSHVVVSSGTSDFEIFTALGDSNSSKSYTSDYSLTYIGTIQGENKVILIKKMDSTITLEINSLAGTTWALEDSIDLSSSGIWDGATNLGTNSARTKIFIYNSIQIMTVDLSNNNTISSIFDITQNGCSLTDMNVFDILFYPVQDRILFSNTEDIVCVYSMTDGTITEKTITAAADYTIAAAFGTDWIAFTARDDRKLIIHDYMNDEIVMTYTFTDSDYVDYQGVSGNGDYLVGPQENDKLFMLQADDLCKYMISTVTSSVNKMAIDSDMSKIYVLDENLDSISVDKSTWGTFEGCTTNSNSVTNAGGAGGSTPGGSPSGDPNEEDKNQGANILMFNIVLIMIISLLY